MITGEDLRRAIEAMDARMPAGGRIVARAWLDPAFKAPLLADGNAAARRLGLEAGAIQLIVVENTPAVHNMIVCTLCSCYPRTVLGLPPDWYKSRAYRSRAVREPRAVLGEFGTRSPTRSRSASVEFDRGLPLSRAAGTACRDRRHGTRRTRRAGHPRQHDRRRPRRRSRVRPTWP